MWACMYFLSPISAASFASKSSDTILFLVVSFWNGRLNTERVETDASFIKFHLRSSVPLSPSTKNTPHKTFFTRLLERFCYVK